MARAKWVAVFGAIVVGLAPLPAGSQETSNSGCYKLERTEVRLAQKINRIRDKHDAGQIKIDFELSKVASVHAKEMARTGRIQHTETEVLAKRVTRWLTLGESVVRSESIAGAFRKIRTRPAHRDNLLAGNWIHLGVGVKQRDGKRFVTVIYEAKRNPGTTLPMPSC